jgi:hypothetical protein
MQQQADNERNGDADCAAKRGGAVELRPVNADGRSENVLECRENWNDQFSVLSCSSNFDDELSN